MIKYLEENNLKELIKDKKVLVDFYADWCGPCKMLSSVLENVDFIDIIKINTDMYPELAREYGVMSIPMIILFENGKLKKQSVGFMDLEGIKKFVE